MEVTLSPFQQEVDLIQADGPKSAFASWTAFFSIREPNPVVVSTQDMDTTYLREEEQEKIFRPLSVMNIDFRRDYEQDMGDYVVMRAKIPLGLWVKVLYPYRDYLRVTLVREALKDTDKSVDKEEAKESDIYTAIPLVESNLVGEGRDIDHISRTELDLKGVMDIDFQLFDQSIETLRTVTVGGIFRRVTPEDVVKGMLVSEAKKWPIEDGPSLDAVDMVEANLQEKREHILIPQGTPYMAVPMYVHRKCGGVYNSGLGAYLQNKVFYVYPLYNTSRFDKVDKTLTVFKIPAHRMTGVDRTYRMDGDKLYVLATSESSFNDATEMKYIESGNGVRFSDSRQFMTLDLVETKDNKAVAKRKKLNSEFMAVERDERNNVPMSAERINSNPMYEYSKLAQKQGSIYSFEWENSDGSLLYPGMPVKILYHKNEDVHELHGVLLKAHTAIQLRGQAVTADTHRNNTTLFIFANKVEEQG